MGYRFGLYYVSIFFKYAEIACIWKNVCHYTFVIFQYAQYMNLQNVFDFFVCGTYIHESSVLLTILYYLWIGIWEEAVKF